MQQGNKAAGFVITGNTRHVSDSGKDEQRSVTIPDTFTRTFRLLDDDGLVYFHGRQDPKNFDEFGPLDNYGAAYGCATLQYKNDRQWVTL